MPLVLNDRVQQTGTANTTVSFTLSGTVTGFQSFAVIGNGNTTYYSATDGSGNWEVGLGTYSTTGPTLTRTTVYASSNSNTAVTFSGTINVFVTYPSSKSVYEDESGNVSPLGTIISAIWQGSTIGVAYGGTGVTTSSGANSVVLRDANQNINVNRVNQSNTNTTAAGSTTALTAASSYIQTLVGTGGQTYTLPDATTLTTGVAFIFNNLATGTLTIQNFASGPIGTITAGGAGAVFLTNNGTVGGTWDLHGYLPEGVTWGTNALNLGTTIISGGTWQGGTIASGYGGTGLTTFAAANNALYSTSASALAAGTLPIAAGGTGQTSRQAAMDALAGSTTSGQYLRGNGSDVVMANIVAGDVPTLNQNTTGSAATLTTGRTIAITGDLTYTSGSFNGSANVTGTGTLATVNSNVGSFTNASVTVNAKGLITAASSGTAPVTNVTATSPVASTGGTTPVISMTQSSGSVNGWLSSTDWNTFNNKTSNTGTVTSVSGTGGYGGLTLSGTVTTSGNITLGGTPTGTWPISVSGASTSCSGNSATTSGATFSNDAVNKADITTRTDSGFYEHDSGTTAEGWPVNDNSWQHMIACTHTNDANYYSMQIAGSFFDNVFYGRKTNGSGSTAWVNFITSDNIGSQNVNFANTSSVAGAAGTASQLTTARTINGTSFNGTANITTSSWGTTRTLWGNSVNGGSNVTGALQPNAGSAAAPAFSTSGDTNTGMYFSFGDNVSFSTGGAERMRINQLGSVGIGSSLILYSNVLAEFSNPSGSGILVRSADGTAQSGIQFLNQSGTAQYFPARFFNNGTSFSQCGSISVSGTTTSFTTSSDYRLKENVQPMTGALDKVALLKPVTYNWKSDGTEGQGFIAHELAEVIPDAVVGEKDGTMEQQYEVTPATPAELDEDGNEITPAVEAVMGTRTVPSYQGVDTSFLVATLTAAIQELKAELDVVKAELNALKG